MPELPTTSSTETAATQSYEEFLEDIKSRIRSAQARAARAINAELIEVYWQIGREILQRQAEEGNRREMLGVGLGFSEVIHGRARCLSALRPLAQQLPPQVLSYPRAGGTPCRRARRLLRS
jgi:hypothetical protein